MSTDLSALPAGAVTALRESGWQPGRRVPTDHWDATLRAEGFELNDVARDLLEQLGGLRVNPPREPAASFPNEAILFEPVLAGTGSLDIAQRLTGLTGQDFYPLAEWVAASCVYAGSGGRICGYRDGEIFDIGASPSAGLRTMLLADSPLRALEQV